MTRILLASLDPVPYKVGYNQFDLDTLSFALLDGRNDLMSFFLFVSNVPKNGAKMAQHSSRVIHHQKWHWIKVALKVAEKIFISWLDPFIVDHAPELLMWRIMTAPSLHADMSTSADYLSIFPLSLTFLSYINIFFLNRRLGFHTYQRRSEAVSWDGISTETVLISDVTFLGVYSRRY